MSPTNKEVAATHLVQILKEAGFIAYFAGGWVRDHLLGIPCDDIDIATSAPPRAVMQLFPKTIPVGIDFGSVVVVHEGMNFEVTTFRTESGYADGRHPTCVAFSSPEVDASRRDFTINGMFYDPLTRQILDFVGGRADLNHRLLRAIGDPEQRFLEDKLRMMRAVRFATCLDFHIESCTRAALFKTAHLLFPYVAVERVWQEFEKIKLPAHFPTYLEKLHALNLLQQLFPELQQGLPPVNKIADYPLATPTILKLMALFADQNLTTRLAIGERLKIPRRDLELVRLQDELEQLLRQPHVTPTQWARFYAHKEAELLIEVAACSLIAEDRTAFQTSHRNRSSQLTPHIVRIRGTQPLVSAAQLIELGIRPGKLMGLLLKEAERLSIDCDLHRPQDVLNLLKQTPLFQSHHQKRNVVKDGSLTAKDGDCI